MTMGRLFGILLLCEVVVVLIVAPTAELEEDEDEEDEYATVEGTVVVVSTE